MKIADWKYAESKRMFDYIQVLESRKQENDKGGEELLWQLRVAGYPFRQSPD